MTRIVFSIALCLSLAVAPVAQATPLHDGWNINSWFEHALGWLLDIGERVADEKAAPMLVPNGEKAGPMLIPNGLQAEAPLPEGAPKGGVTPQAGPMLIPNG